MVSLAESWGGYFCRPGWLRGRRAHWPVDSSVRADSQRLRQQTEDAALFFGVVRRLPRDAGLVCGQKFRRPVSLLAEGLKALCVFGLSHRRLVWL